MSLAPLLKVEHLRKVYPKIGGKAGLRALWALLRQAPQTGGFVALDDISFEVRRGESLALIGENGAGKSTLLKLVAQVAQPSSGTVMRNGTVGALLELGAGFHGEYTGRENLQLAGALQGLSTSALAAKLDDIIEFADIGPHIDAPVKTYSSGMVVRLGFALITALKPDILITDEVLAVGDESFQSKCIAWMERYLAQGGTLLLVSHSMYHVQKLARYAIWLDHGKVKTFGPAGEVARDYLAFHEAKRDAERVKQLEKGESVAIVHGARYGVARVRVRGDRDSQFRDAGEGAAQCENGLEVEGEIFSEDDRPPQVAVGIMRADKSPVFGSVSELAGYHLERVAAQRFRFEIRFNDWRLLPGAYVFKAHAMDPEGMRLFDIVERPFNVIGATRFLGYVHLPHRWGR